MSRAKAKLHPRDPRHPRHAEWLLKVAEANRKSWANPTIRRNRLAGMSAARINGAAKEGK